MTAESEVNKVIGAFVDAWNRHDIDALAQLFATDAEFVNVVGLWWKGKEQIKQAHEFAHATMFKNSNPSILETSVRFPVSQFAIARSRRLLEGHVDPQGQALPARTGILVNLLLSVDTEWTIIDSQNTDIIEDVLSRPQ